MTYREITLGCGDVRAVQAKREPDAMTGEGELCCPFCGGYNLHHEVVRVTTLQREDAIALEVVVSGGGAHTSHSSDTPRRGSLRIEFSCESCPRQPVLVLRQHKGTEYLTWCL